MLDVVITAGRFDDERMLKQLRQGHTGMCSQRMPLREHSAQRIVPERVEFQVVCHNGREETAVHLPTDDPFPDLIIVAVQNFNLHLRVVFLEIMHNFRHPERCDAGNAAHPQLALHLVVDIERRLPQPGLLVGQLPDVGQKAGAVICQGHAPVDAGEQLHAQFLFQPCHHLADAGLGIVQCLRCFGKAARFAYFQEYLVSVFLFPHCKRSISKIYRSQ